MYRKTLCEKDESLKDFSKLFNFNKSYPHLRFIPNRAQTYDNDGIIYNELTGTFIGFDWEYREKYSANCQLQSDSLEQYEKKMQNLQSSWQSNVTAPKQKLRLDGILTGLQKNMKT